MKTEILNEKNQKKKGRKVSLNFSIQSFLFFQRSTKFSNIKFKSIFSNNNSKCVKLNQILETRLIAGCFCRIQYSYSIKKIRRE